MPAYTDRQQRFMGAELARAESGQRTQTRMSKSQLRDMAHKPTRATRRVHRRSARRS